MRRRRNPGGAEFIPLLLAAGAGVAATLLYQSSAGAATATLPAIPAGTPAPTSTNVTAPVNGGSVAAPTGATVTLTAPAGGGTIVSVTPGATNSNGNGRNQNQSQNQNRNGNQNALPITNGTVVLTSIASGTTPYTAVWTDALGNSNTTSLNIVGQ